MFDKIIIIGLGLIGGSIARISKKNKLANKIVALSRNQETLDFALNNKIIDGVYDFEQEISDNDLVVIATPLSKYEEVLANIAPNISPNTIITDVGSVKSFIETDILPKFNILKSSFVSCHPIAGSDKSGVQNSRTKLFEDKKLIIIKSSDTDRQKMQKIEEFWQKIGSNIEYMTAKKHDEIYALASHLPQFISYNFHYKSHAQIDDELIQKHFRLQNSNPEIWKDIFKLNRHNISKYFHIFEKNLDILKDFIKEKKYEEVIFILNNIGFPNIKAKKIPEYKEKVIISRIIITSAYILIKDIDDCEDYFGTGFKDFVRIMSYLQYLLKNEDLFKDLLIKNRRYILARLESTTPTKLKVKYHKKTK